MFKLDAGCVHIFRARVAVLNYLQCELGVGVWECVAQSRILCKCARPLMLCLSEIFFRLLCAALNSCHSSAAKILLRLLLSVEFRRWQDRPAAWTSSNKTI